MQSIFYKGNVFSSSYTRQFQVHVLIHFIPQFLISEKEVFKV